MKASPIWQAVFVSCALLLIIFEMARGWRLGLVRQLFRLLALVAAYAAGYFGGRLLLPILRPFFRVPDLMISLLAGALLALAVYAAISTLGARLSRRTGQQSPGTKRWLYGISGALLGVFFGLFSVWLVVVAIRSVGALASAEMRAPTPAPIAAQAASESPPTHDASTMLPALAKLKNSIELGPLGATFKAVDVVPDQTYQTLGKLGTVVSNPPSAVRFLTYPGARALTEHPRIVALRNDPEIMDLIEQRRYLELFQNPKLIDAMNDPSLAAQVRSFEFRKALDYALQK